MLKKRVQQKISYEHLDTAEKSKQRLALIAIQKQLQVLRQREVILLASFVFAGVIGRVLMQPLPSVEPITFFAVLSGWLFGKKRGFLAGASSLYLSNFFVIGGQGPWTLFQAAGFGMAGFLGGFLRKRARIIECVLVMILSTLLFEIIMNISSVIFLPISIFTLFFTALPFTLIHILSNSIFATLLPWIKGYVGRKGNFNEREAYIMMRDKLKSSFMGRS